MNARTFTKALRNKLAKTSDGGPSVSVWLARVEALKDPRLSEAIEGIWCGRDGRVTLPMDGTTSRLCMGWYSGRVEWSYLS